MAFEVDSRTLLNKLAFGPSEAELHGIAKMGAEGWLAQQLNPPPEDDCAARIASTHIRLKYVSKTPEAEVDEERSLAVLAQPIEQHWKVVEGPADRSDVFPHRRRLRHDDPRRAQPLAAARGAGGFLAQPLQRECGGRQPHRGGVADLRQRRDPPPCARQLPRDAGGRGQKCRHADLPQQPVLARRRGQRDLRELFELHTLGRPAYLNALYNRWRDVPGALDRRPQGYIDQDAHQAARAFTGWSIEDGAGIGAGRRLLMTGKFIYVENWHDNYQKRVLATEFDPYQLPLADGRRVLDLVADHPATARYVCEKLCRRLVSDTPDAAVVAAAVKAWTEQRRKPDQIARTVEAIVHSDAFRRSAGTKVKRPLELFASFARSAGIAVTPTPGLLGELDGSGQRLFGWGRRPATLTKTTIGRVPP